VPTGHTAEEPPSSLAHAPAAWAIPFHCTAADPGDPLVRATLDAWLGALPVLTRRPLSARTRGRLDDFRSVASELARVLDGVEDGEGRRSERTVHLATARGRVHAVSSMFACPAGTFIELLVTAPWNVLGPEDPPDPRTVRGAGTALVEAATRWSGARGCGGAVSLQAATRRAAAFYDRLGFRTMQRGDLPLTLVPPGERGWSASVLRVAAGRPGAEEHESPWMLLPPRVAAGAAAWRLASG
jgi:GNAT superfamily N-acetyltransferase